MLRLPFALPLTLVLACAAAAPARAAQTTLTLVPAQSTVTWRLGAIFHTVDGTFALKRGEIDFDPADGKAEGSVVLDLTSGQSENATRDRRMQTEILQTQTFPDAVFTADRVDGRLADDGVSGLDVHGTMAIHGTTHEMTLRLDVARKGAGYLAHTHFTVPYVAWGMKNPSTFILHVDDHVDVDIAAALTKGAR